MKQKMPSSTKVGRIKRSSKPRTWDTAKQSGQQTVKLTAATEVSLELIADRLAPVTGWSAKWILGRPEKQILGWAAKYL
jgi:hypothetical protein